MELDEFYQELQHRIRLKAQELEDFPEPSFLELVTEELCEAGVIEDYSHAHLSDVKSGPYRNSRVDGYCFSEENDSVDLFIVDYKPIESLDTLTFTEMETIFARLERFFLASISNRAFEEMEESAPVYGLAHQLNGEARKYCNLRFFLVSARTLSGRVQSLEKKRLDEWDVSYHVWDVSRQHRMFDSRGQREDVIIDFVEEFGEPLACLSAHIGADEYQSYLAVVPGEQLANLYGTYGGRLLELNVRTFLQARNKVNKGIRNTIVNNPDRFFAYNNGITATAEEVEIVDGAIASARNLQIVNGGQTTASLYHASRKQKADLSRIFVQMKLSIVNPEIANEVVPKISEYANTQNKVNASDFFSNHPFHVRMEEFSRRLWAPATDGSQKETKWFYERARGQYAEAQSDMTPARSKAYKLEYPKPQMFTKTDLAKFDNCWDGYAREVNLGAQKNFAHYAQRIAAKWDEDNTTFNEDYFRQAVGRAIIFRATEKMVSKQDWYQGGYRANIVAYTQGLLSKAISDMKMSLDYQALWQKQTLSPALLFTLETIARGVNEFVTAAPDHVRNVTEWCKRVECWNGLKNLDVELADNFKKELIPLSEVRQRNKDAKKTQTIDDGIMAQKKVLELLAPFWRKALEYGMKSRALSPTDSGILQAACMIPQKIPSEKQSVRLLQILQKLEEEGFKVD